MSISVRFLRQQFPALPRSQKTVRDLLGRFCLCVICVVFFVDAWYSMQSHTAHRCIHAGDLIYTCVFRLPPAGRLLTRPTARLRRPDDARAGLRDRQQSLSLLETTAAMPQHHTAPALELPEHGGMGRRARKTVAASGGDSPTLFVLSRFVAGVPTESQHGHQAGVRVRRFDIQPGAITKVSGIRMGQIKRCTFSI